MVKDGGNTKLNRVYDEDGFLKRAAAVCVKDSDQNQILLVSSSKEPQGWIIPGGGLETNEEAFEAAVREVSEEAGVLGRLGQSLGVFENAERKHRTTVFVLFVVEELNEWDDSRVIGRRRQWFHINEAVQLVKPVQSSYLLRFQQLRTNEETPS